MACKGCLEWLLKLLNILLTLVGLAMIGYGIYLFVEYTRTDDNVALVSTLSDGQGLTQLGRPMLMAVSLSDSISDKLSKRLCKLHLVLQKNGEDEHNSWNSSRS
ncbi:TOBAMOVIRUS MULTIPLICATION PROTEIN 2A [Salix koriyanagi]|uniref:TOBAMOVIRUS MULTIPLICATION PROTEIN 2A n=1 Tax=Salix koriyanagi TaxID=2511006 RepID=A0A9Q0PWU5_9ROSI|nr:TOBAMOVIRUS MULTIPLICATION PROTEIN 2A [Salix koriyanagi]